jgi:hypothetical protein
VHCTPEGIVQAQANHTRTLGSKAAFAAANPQFDGEWFEEVTASVASCREVAAAEEPAAGPGTLDAPISCAEIHDALLTLKNGTAPSPVSRIPNELLKYGGGAIVEPGLDDSQRRHVLAAVGHLLKVGGLTDAGA